MDADEFPTVVSEGAGFVRIKVTGQVSVARLEKLGQRIIGESMARKLPRVLVDISAVTGDIPTVDKFEIGIKAARDLAGNIRLAILADKRTADPFFETVTRNRGADVLIFFDAEAAAAWLNAASPAPPPR